MRRPDPPVKHELLPARWPTRQEAERALWFSPIELGPVRLEQRTWVPAMVPWRATDDGLVTDDVVSWYARFAQGKPGAIVVEATGIRDIPSGPLLRAGHDRFIPGLARLVRAVREASAGQTRLFIQLIDFLRIRRRPQPEQFFQRHLEIADQHRSAVPEARSDDELRAALIGMPRERLERVLTERELESLDYGQRERVTDLELPWIRELPRLLPELFARAAARAEQAGFDGVELHYAHAYTMASFLSAINRRDDGYGGSRENRVRLPLEVVAAVRARISERFALGCRYLSEECIAGGSTLGDAEYFGVELGRAGVDFLSLSRGGKFEDAKQPKVGWAAYPYTGPSGWECMPTVRGDEQGPFGRNVPAAGRIRAALRAAGLRTPIVVSGGIASFDQAEQILARGEADIVAAARQTLADPDWFLKIRLGNGNQVRRCVFTNYCEGLDQKHKQVTCKLWDREQLDQPELALSSDGRRRLTAPAWKRSE
jgi:dimethylglycine catabolism A